VSSLFRRALHTGQFLADFRDVGVTCHEYCGGIDPWLCAKKADPADLSKSSVKAITNYQAKKAPRTLISSLLHR
jgi:hypothetical protein